MDIEEEIEERLAQYPIYQYAFLNSSDLPFTERVREVCRQECDRYNSSWSCPPAVGSIEECRARWSRFPRALFFSTAAEVKDPAYMPEALATRQAHERVTDDLAREFHRLGQETLILSSNSCALCEKCSWPEAACRHPDLMHPCIESHGFVVVSLAEQLHMDYWMDQHTFLWFSLIFFDSYRGIEEANAK